MPGPFLPLKTGLQAVSVQLLSTLTSTALFMTCYFFTFHIELSEEQGKGQKCVGQTSLSHRPEVLFINQLCEY